MTLQHSSNKIIDVFALKSKITISKLTFSEKRHLVYLYRLAHYWWIRNITRTYLNYIDLLRKIAFSVVLACIKKDSIKYIDDDETEIGPISAVQGDNPIVDKIIEYIQAANIKGVDKLNFKKQCFKIESKYYYLENKHLDDINNIIMPFSDKDLHINTIIKELKVKFSSLVDRISVQDLKRFIKEGLLYGKLAGKKTIYKNSVYTIVGKYIMLEIYKALYPQNLEYNSNHPLFKRIKKDGFVFTDKGGYKDEENKYKKDSDYVTMINIYLLKSLVTYNNKLYNKHKDELYNIYLSGQKYLIKMYIQFGIIIVSNTTYFKQSPTKLNCFIVQDKIHYIPDLYPNQNPMKMFSDNKLGEEYNKFVLDDTLRKQKYMHVTFNKVYIKFLLNLIKDKNSQFNIFLAVFYNISHTIANDLKQFILNDKAESLPQKEKQYKNIQKDLNIVFKRLKDKQKELKTLNRKINEINKMYANDSTKMPTDIITMIYCAYPEDSKNLQYEIEQLQLEIDKQNQKKEIFLIEFKVYQEIKGKKYELNMFISDINVFKHFGSIYIHNYFSYIGRLFYQYHGLNPTAHVTRPCFIMVDYNVQFNKKQFENKENKVLKQTYINNLIKDNKIIKDLQLNKLSYNNIKILLSFNIQIYKALQYLITQCCNNYLIELDSSNSGLQILSLLFKSKSAANVCNLHTNKTSLNIDIYDKTLNEFKLQYTMITSLFNKHHKNRDYPSNTLTKYYWIITNKTMIFNNNNITNKLEIFDDLLATFIKTINYYKDALFNRDLFKKVIMTSFYGMKEFSIHRTFIDIIKSIPMDSPQISFNDKITLAKNLSIFFTKQRNILPLYTEFTSIFDNLKITKTKRKLTMGTELEPHKYFNMKTEFYMWNFTVYETKTFKIKLHNVSFKSYQTTKNINYRKLLTSVPAILTHAVDAYLCHYMYKHTQIPSYITKPLHTYKPFRIYTIHDCFLTNVYNIYIMKKLLQSAYLNILNNNFLSKFLKLNKLDSAVNMALIRNKEDPDYLSPNDLNNEKFVK